DLPAIKFRVSKRPSQTDDEEPHSSSRQNQTQPGKDSLRRLPGIKARNVAQTGEQDEQASQPKGPVATALVGLRHLRRNSNRVLSPGRSAEPHYSRQAITMTLAQLEARCGLFFAKTGVDRQNWCWKTFLRRRCVPERCGSLCVRQG